MIFKVRGQKNGYVAGKEKRHKVENFLINAVDERSTNDLLSGPGYGKVYFKLDDELKQSAAPAPAVVETSPIPGILGEETCDQVKMLNDMYPGSIELIRENIAEVYVSKTRMLDIDQTPNPNQGEHDQGDGESPVKITDEELAKLTEEELKTKLTTMGIRFFPGAKIETLRGQLRSALDKLKNAGSGSEA